MVLKFKPLSVNKAWQGKRFKTPEYKSYENVLLTLIKIQKPIKVSGLVEVYYKFYIKEFSRSDVGNFEKPLTDIIVKAGLIDDDRYIVKTTLEKFKSDNNYIEIYVSPYILRTSRKR